MNEHNPGRFRLYTLVVLLAVFSLAGYVFGSMPAVAHEPACAHQPASSQVDRSHCGDSAPGCCLHAGFILPAQTAVESLPILVDRLVYENSCSPLLHLAPPVPPPLAPSLTA